MVGQHVDQVRVPVWIAFGKQSQGCHLTTHVPRRSPLMFLVLSVACFSAGLVAFAYSSSQVMPLRGAQLQAADSSFSTM